MKSTVRIERSTGAQDPLTGLFERVTVYEGPARVATWESFESTAEAAGATITAQRYHLHIPVSAPKMDVDDVATIIASDNPLLVGNVYRVAGTHEKDDQTAQRLLVERIM